MRHDVLLPQMGMGMHEAVVIEWLVRVGDVVAQGDDLAAIEIEKTETTLPAPCAGRVVELLVGLDETVPVFTTLAVLETDG